MWVGALPDARRHAFQIRVPPPRSPQVHFPSQLDVVACERGAVPVLHCGSTEVAGTGITASSSAAASDQKGDRHLLVADTAAYIMSRDQKVLASWPATSQQAAAGGADG